MPYMSSTKYVYQPLNPSVDCIRVAKFEAIPNIDAPIHCSLVHFEFGEKPQYQALSYTWGDESVKKTIFVDGKELEVGINLWEALRFLSPPDVACYLWADAICINQNDLAERTRQLRIMPHIYARAQTVLVWLGTKLTSQALNSCQHEPEYDRATLLELCDHPYWQRVCFDQTRMLWEDFIKQIKPSWWSRPVKNDTGPLSLDRQLQSKYRNGHTLVKLLARHEHAQCKDPRDKVYGFVGLAIDSFGFPMDYAKSIHEVWEDTIDYVISKGLIDEVSNLSFCKLVKRLLRCEEIETSNNETSKTVLFSPCLSTSKKSSTSIKIPVSIAGMITDLGPSPNQLIAHLKTTDIWAAIIHQSFNADPGPASEAHQKFMHALEAMHESDLRVVSRFKTNVRWETPEGPWSPTYWDFLQRTINNGPASVAPPVPENSGSKATADTDHTAFLYKHRNYPHKIFGRIGIGPAQIRVVDLVCCVSDLDKAIIVRTSPKENLFIHLPFSELEEPIHDVEIVGTALLSVGLDNPGNYDLIALHADDLDYDVELVLDTKAAYALMSNCSTSDLPDGDPRQLTF
ncbi:hypothetical protein LTR96_011045 [Exophiala xenobiotica]|nr:hypothetical protein LTR41_011140 [Exophiala xenobiotica]KAK5220798.1 hypothetical protein LTR47_011147 [Exophiala xenobiotica]KAK5245250.1 hypothetical protein LTS06_009302 [Exophiala xenobiotica]KAK5263564.1 hypothetical protein LTR96_011045 [Exophiala xenobiotica]KAK5332689.1 hypothetical protein LTR98_011188 [Exophiala xenobiotica]